MLMVQVDGTSILLVNQDGLHALQGTCTHEYFELDKGFLTAGSVTCALHLSRFDLIDGEPLDPPAELPLVTFPVSVDGERDRPGAARGRDSPQRVTLARVGGSSALQQGPRCPRPPPHGARHRRTPRQPDRRRDA